MSQLEESKAYKKSTDDELQTMETVNWVAFIDKN